MQIEFTGVVHAKDTSFSTIETASSRARLLCRHGFDRVRIVDETSFDGALRLASVLLNSPTLPAVTIVHRAGVIEPIEAAERLAALDQAGDGRLVVQLSDVPHPDERVAFIHEVDQARRDEYLVLLKRLWLNQTPIDHEGTFFRVEKGMISSRPLNGNTIPLALGGRSATALRVAARHADIYALGGITVPDAAQLIERIEAAASPFGRSGKISYAVDVRPQVDAAPADSDPAGPLTLGGTAEQIAVSLLAYVDLGIRGFTVHGLEHPEAVASFAGRVMPLVRRALDHRNAQQRWPKVYLSGAGMPYLRAEN